MPARSGYHTSTSKTEIMRGMLWDVVPSDMRNINEYEGVASKLSTFADTVNTGNSTKSNPNKHCAEWDSSSREASQLSKFEGRGEKSYTSYDI